MTTEIGTDVQKARALLERGLLVAIPTETVYGLAANAYDSIAVTRIFEVKGRPTFDPLIIHSNSIAKIQTFVEEIPAWAVSLSEHFWPGPLTLILKKKAIVPDIVTSGLDTVAVRVPRHALTLDLLESLEMPLAAPSANPFGYVSPTRPDHVIDQLGGRISYILDGGVCEVGLESTIIGEVDGVPSILRLGGVDLEAIRELLPDIAVHTNPTSNPISPGSLESHYATHKPLYIGEPDLVQFRPEEIGTITFSKVYPEIPKAQQQVLSFFGDLREAASRLFHAMRELDRSDVKVIYAERVLDQGIGRAINDRLERASIRRQGNNL